MNTITPPQWQMDAWQARIETMGADVPAILLEAAQWGADQELEACCEEMKSIPSPLGIPFGNMASNALRAARRPNPPSLKEQALAQLSSVETDLRRHGIINTDYIRRALEALPE